MIDPLILATVVVAAIAAGLAKSGLLSSATAICVPLLTFSMPARDAAGVILPVLVALDVVGLAVYARQFDKRILLIVVPGALVGIGVGWVLSAVVSESMVRLAIGLISFGFVMDAWLPLRQKLSGLKLSRGWGTFWGAVSGFTSFVSHTGGPPYQIYVLPRQLPPALYAGTAAVFFAIVNGVKIIPYYALGQLETSNLMLAALMIPLAFIAMLAGVYLVRRVQPQLFYRLTYGLLLVFSLKLIWDGVTGLAA